MSAGPETQTDDSSQKDRSLLAELYGPDGPPDLDAFAGPVHWPAIPAIDIPAAWTGLRDWVEELVERFAHLDHSVIPNCWWRHNSHVEALQALRDYERVSYSDSSPGTAGIEWHRAFALVEGRLREWTGQLACKGHHDEQPRRLRHIPDDTDQWDHFVTSDTQRRQHAEIVGSAR